MNTHCIFEESFSEEEDSEYYWPDEIEDPGELKEWYDFDPDC